MCMMTTSPGTARTMPRRRHAGSLLAALAAVALAIPGTSFVPSPARRAAGCESWLSLPPSSTRAAKTQTRTQASLPGTEHALVSRRKHAAPLRIAAALRAAASSSDDNADEDDGEELVGLAEHLAEKAERERKEMFAGLAGGGIFPSDMSSATAEITVKGAKLEPGRPEDLVGFWKLYGSTAAAEDVSGRLILRADGQVIGGPTVRTTPGVEWSDPEGLQPVGGEWVVYKDKNTGRARLNVKILLSHQKQHQLEMDGVVMTVDTRDEETGAVDLVPQVFGGVTKRNGDGETEAGEGDFSMMKVKTGEDKLVAIVGSQRKRLW